MTDLNQLPDTNGRVRDATEKNWVDRFCPVWSRPFLRLSRADRPVGTWLLVIPCWWGLLFAILSTGAVPTLFDGWIAIGCLLGAFLMRGAGCTWNDITDRKYDAQVARTKSRPLPSGQVTTKGAVIWMGVQALLGLVILLTLNNTAILLGFASLVLVAIYPFAKRFTWWPQIFLGLAFNWGVLLAFAAHAGTITFPVVVLYVSAISWTLFYDTIYAHQDAEDDALIGLKSTARLFGENSPKWLFWFMISTLLLMTVAVSGIVSGALNVLSLMICLTGIWVFGWHLTWQLRRLNIEDSENCLHLFRSNRDAGLLFALALAVAVFAA
jgi:4-hydroxybenzoate polyprenyltransferase